MKKTQPNHPKIKYIIKWQPAGHAGQLTSPRYICTLWEIPITDRICPAWKAESRSHLTTGILKGEGWEKSNSKEEQKNMLKKKTFQVCSKAYKNDVKGSFLFSSFRQTLDCVPPWRTVSKCGLSNEALRICIWRLKIHSDCSPPGRDSASFAVWLNRAQGWHSWKWDLTSRNMTRKRAEWWLWLVKCGFSHAPAQRQLKYQPKIPPQILNQVLGLVNTLRILTYVSTERWILT